MSEKNGQTGWVTPDPEHWEALEDRYQRKKDRMGYSTRWNFCDAHGVWLPCSECPTDFRHPWLILNDDDK